MKLVMMIFFILGGVSAHAKLKVACTTQDVEALVKVVGGDQVDTFSIAKGTQDPHQIEAKPSFMVKFRDANLVVLQGLDLESAWLIPLLQGSRNSDLSVGSKGYLALGPLLEPLEVSGPNVSRAEGDVHPLGNPHFQLDPIRLSKAAVLIADRLAELDSSHEKLFRANAKSFSNLMEEDFKKWRARITKTGIKEFVSYHKSFSYFADRFGLKNSLFLEPKPGIPPTASHIVDVLNQMQARDVKLVLIENFFDDSARGKIEKEIPNVRIIKVPVYVGGLPGVNTNDQLIEKIVSAIEGQTSD